MHIEQIQHILYAGEYMEKWTFPSVFWIPPYTTCYVSTDISPKHTYIYINTIYTLKNISTPCGFTFYGFSMPWISPEFCILSHLLHTASARREATQPLFDLGMNFGVWIQILGPMKAPCCRAVQVVKGLYNVCIYIYILSTYIDCTYLYSFDADLTSFEFIEIFCGSDFRAWDFKIQIFADQDLISHFWVETLISFGFGHKDDCHLSSNDRKFKKPGFFLGLVWGFNMF